MDGLLGDFGNFIKTPEGQGLLSAAFGGLAGARPGQPWNTLGRAGVSGLLGYQNAQENQLTTKLADLKMKSMEDELAEKKRIADFYGNVGQFMPSQASQALAANANAGRAGPTGQFMPEDMPAPQFNANAMYQAMLKSGSPTLAQVGLQGMVKEKPKVKDWQKVNVGGNVLYAPYFEDGTVGQPVPYQVAEKLHFANTGGETVGMDAFTGTKVAGVRNTQSPESVASVAATIRGQNMTDARARELNAITHEANQTQVINDPVRGLILVNKGTGLARNATGLDGQPMPSEMQAKRKASAENVLPILTEAEKLIGGATGSYAGAGADQVARFFGSATPGAIATSKLKVLEGNLMMAQPRMEGPQSNTDVLLYRQMAGQIGDPTVPNEIKLQALGTIRQLTEKYAGIEKPSAPPMPKGFGSGLPSGWSVKEH